MNNVRRRGFLFWQIFIGRAYPKRQDGWRRATGADRDLDLAVRVASPGGSTGTEIAGEAREGAAGDEQLQTMTAGQHDPCGGQQRDVDRAPFAGRRSGQPAIAIRDVDRSAVLIDIAEANEEIVVWPVGRHIERQIRFPTSSMAVSSTGPINDNTSSRAASGRMSPRPVRSVNFGLQGSASGAPGRK